MQATAMAASQDNSTAALALSEEAFSPELQLANLLGLCEAQMESALQESDRAVDTLIKAFGGLVEVTRSLSTMAANLPPEVKAGIAQDLDRQLATMSQQMGTAVMAFQFYDKLTQRLGHVRYSLSTLALFACDRTQMNQPEQWTRLLNTMRRLYRTEEERQVFSAIMD
ncbi:MAG TPA: hypothetical protein VIL28_10035, partial [Steroidobacteraceae bacterium]